MSVGRPEGVPKKRAKSRRHVQGGLGRRSGRGRQDIHRQQYHEPVHRIRPVRANGQVVIDPARAVREIASDVFYAALVYVSVGGRLSGKCRRVR